MRSVEQELFEVPFKHFLITRFNILVRNTPQKKWNGGMCIKSKATYLDEAWLDERLRLFKKYCLPSVVGQDTKNFTWIILMDPSTPRIFLNKLMKLPSNAQLYFHPGPDYTAAADAIWQNKGEEARFMISTALDSDDAIASNYLSTVQKEFREKREFINLTKGVVVADHKGYQYIGDRASSSVNHFRSFVEPRDNIFSVYGIYHGRSDNLAPVRHIECDAPWLEVTHMGNLANHFRKHKHDKTRPLDELAKTFSLDPESIANPFVLKKGYVMDPTWDKPKGQR